MDEFSKSSNKDSFNEGSNLELFLELMDHSKYNFPKDCLNWQLVKVWSMESSSPQNEQSLSCFIPKRNSFLVVIIVCKKLN